MKPEIITPEQRIRIRRQLAEVGLRATPQRLLILTILENAQEHLDAEAIYERARAWDAKISLATVYRALARLKEAGLVEQRYFARDHRREYYEAVSKGEHYHFTCLGCGKVIEVTTPRIAQARKELSEALGLEFTHACICFEGYCPDCAAKRRQGVLKARPRVPTSLIIDPSEDV